MNIEKIKNDINIKIHSLREEIMIENIRAELINTERQKQINDLEQILWELEKENKHE